MVRLSEETSEPFCPQKGVRQGCILSPYLFNIYGERIMRSALSNSNGGFTIGGEIIKELRYADDTTIIAQNITDLKNLLDRIKEESEAIGLYLNANKTKMMRISNNTDRSSITIDDTEIEDVNEFNFLGSYINTDGNHGKEIQRRTSLGKAAVGSLSKIWSNHGISKTSKIQIMNSLVFSIVTYGAESWTMKKRDECKISAFETWAWRRLLGISWRDKVSNDQVLRNINTTPRLLSKIHKMQLTYFGHIARRDGESLEKTIMTGLVPGNRSRGRPRQQ